jgi:hypothetical protein
VWGKLTVMSLGEEELALGKAWHFLWSVNVRVVGSHDTVQLSSLSTHS